MARQKSKDVIVTVHPVLATMIAYYEFSRNGTGQLSDEHRDYRRVDLSFYVDGDDMANYLTNDSSTYLLYWWYKLDAKGFVQFTICVLDTF